jgi:ribosomal protein L7/L12
MTQANQLIEAIKIYDSLPSHSNEKNAAKTLCFHLIANVFIEDDELTQQEIDAGSNESKIAAVRLYRERTQKTLKDAHDFVSQYFFQNNLKFKNK